MGPLGPFESTFERLGDMLINKVQDEVFGDSGAARSVRVIVYNHTDRDLYYLTSSFDSGGFTAGEQPSVIAAKSAGGYKVESHGLMSGVTGADARFGWSPSDSNYAVHLLVSNPYAGDNHLDFDGQGAVVRATMSVGNTAQVDADVYPAA